MRRYLISSLLLGLAACSYDPNSGDASFHPLLLSHPNWEITQQNANGATRFCSISAGELTVALKADGQGLRQQVNTAMHILPGETYSLDIANHHYDTKEDWFNANDSDAIIADMVSGQSYVYTELFKMNAANHDMRRNNRADKIPLGAFAGQYQVCKSYVQGK